MKYEFTFELVELHILPVKLGGDVRLPVFGNPGEFLGDIDFIHRHSKILSAHPSQMRFNADVSFGDGLY
jgi:hypothetical protein